MSRPWLHRHVHNLTTFAARTYYRVRVAGVEVPGTGPLLLVANHPNSLLDPALVAIAAGRPVRWLARSGLFEQRDIGWLIRGSGAIPVYRPSDDPELRSRNREMFEAAHNALLEGDAVGVFPEGVSHSSPSLQPLKTGAARIALGAAALGGGEIPIFPVGLTFRGGKERFRSDALLLVGSPVRWGDLAAEEPLSGPAVRELTSRIQAGLNRVTVNLEGWEDFPLIEGAEAIHHAEYGRARSGNPVRWLARMRRTATTLERARTLDRIRHDALAADIVEYTRLLDSLGLRPRDLHHVPKAAVAARWTLKNVTFFGLAAPLALIGAIVFVAPYQLLIRMERRLDIPPDKLATYKVLGGAAAFGGWTLILAALLREFVGWRPAVAVLIVLPLLGILTLAIRNRWHDAAADLRRFLVLRGRRDLRQGLLARQAELAERLRDLQHELAPGRSTHPDTDTPLSTRTP